MGNNKESNWAHRRYLNNVCRWDTRLIYDKGGVMIKECIYCERLIDTDEIADHFTDTDKCVVEITDETLCYTCNGSGEGYTDGSRCSACRGSGMEFEKMDAENT